MKIASKFKDYYDYVSHTIGQDPAVTYIRGKIPHIELEEPDRWNRATRKLNNSYLIFPGIGQGYTDPNKTVTIEYLVAGEYVFVVENTTIRHHDPELAGDYVYETTRRAMMEPEAIATFPKLLGQRHYWGNDKTLEQIAKDIPELTAKVGYPVYLLRNDGAKGFRVDENTPILKDMGVPALVPATEMWQSIYTVMTNVLRKNPDKAVPVELAEKDRIVKAGFDLKTSFRNPINPRAKK